jgi:choline dehydrogenase-like flavoprotein
MSLLLYIASAVSIGALISFTPWIKYEVDDPLGIKQFNRFKSGQTFDYIVIGSGSTGAVIASRLSEDPFVRVLLLEAGGDGSLISDIPAGVGFLLGSAMDWKYFNEPNGKSCLAMKGGRCAWHRGKAIGGSSTINGMLYVRGDKDDYDNWARLGNPGWSYEEILPYFKKSMNQQNPVLARNTQLYSTKGPLVVESPSYKTPLAGAFLKAAKFNGFQVKDVNDGDAEGFSNIQATIDDGKRVSTAKAFLRQDVIARHNLDIVLNSLVTKILVDQDSKAYGVLFKRNGDIQTAFASHEVILSAGAIASPQLLMLSGI